MERTRRPEPIHSLPTSKTPEKSVQRKPILIPLSSIKPIQRISENPEFQTIRAIENLSTTQTVQRTQQLEQHLIRQHHHQTQQAIQRKQALQNNTARDPQLLQTELAVMRASVDLRQEYTATRIQKQQQNNVVALEQSIRRPEVPLQRGKQPTLAGVAEHFIAETSNMKAAREPQYNVLQRVKIAGGTLVQYARATNFPAPELAAAIQRFVDPVENTAARASAFAAIGTAPNLNLELQRALAISDQNLEMQRQSAQIDHVLEPESQAGISDRISAQLSGGNPLPTPIRKQLELHFNTDLSKVRVHTDSTADQLSKSVHAVAFTTGSHIFFQEGTYNPESSDGFELLAHEVTHTIQQDAGQVSAGIDKNPALESAAREEGKKAASNKGNLEQAATRETKQTPSNDYQKYMGFPAAPRSATHEQFMQGARSSTVENLSARASNLHDPSTGKAVSPQWQALTNAVHGEQPAFPRATHLAPHLEKDGTAQNKQTEGIYNANLQSDAPRKIQRKSSQTRETSFTLQREALPIQRFSIKGAISDFLGVIPGYKQICSVFGKDLVTGEKVEQNPNAILDALANLVPGPIKDMVKALRESNAIPKAWAWFKKELSKINIGEAWQGIKDGISSFRVFNLGEVKDKIKAAVMKPISQVKNLIVGSIRKLAEIALEAVGAMFGGTGKQLIDGLKSAGDVIMDVIKNPGKFIKNLVQALKGGVSNFAANAKKHLTNGLGQWLTGESGLAFPSNLDVKGVFTLALTVLGVTYANFRKSLVKKLGEEKTKIAETKVDFVQNMMSKGMMAAEGMQAHEGSVKTEIVEGTKDFVKTSVIQAAVTKLITMFIPGGGLIQAFMTGFEMIKFVINEGSRIASLVSSIMGSISSIARGDVGGAIAKVESSLAKTIPLALSFLSRIFKVSGIGQRIKAIIGKIKGKIDGVVKKVMDKAAAVVAKMASAVGKGVDKGKEVAGKAVNGVKKIINGVFGEKKAFKAGKEQHQTWVEFANNRPTLKVASVPLEAREQLKNIKKLAKGNTALETQITNQEPRVSQIVQKLNTDMSALESRKNSLSESDYLREVRLLVTNAQNGIAPIFAVLFDAAGGGQPPVVGLHPIEDNRPDTSGEKRESHHVPADKFAIGMRNHYVALANAMPSTGKLGILKTQLTARANLIPQNGNGLSAILIHRDTHRLADQAVHSELSAAPTLRLIVEKAKKSAEKFQIVIFVNGGKQAAVNPSRVHWESFISKHFQVIKNKAAGMDVSVEVTDHTIRVAQKFKSATKNADEVADQISSDLSSAVTADQISVKTADEISNAMRSSFTSALTNGISAVTNALANSTKDGDKSTHSQALRRLRTQASETWSSFTAAVRV